MRKAWNITRTIFWIFISVIAFPVICYVAGDKLGDWCLERIEKIWNDPDELAETIMDTVDDIMDE